MMRVCRFMYREATPVTLGLVVTSRSDNTSCFCSSGLQLWHSMLWFKQEMQKVEPEPWACYHTRTRTRPALNQKAWQLASWGTWLNLPMLLLQFVSTLVLSDARTQDLGFDIDRKGRDSRCWSGSTGSRCPWQWRSIRSTLTHLQVVKVWVVSEDGKLMH